MMSELDKLRHDFTCFGTCVSEIDSNGQVTHVPLPLVRFKPSQEWIDYVNKHGILKFPKNIIAEPAA